MRFRMEFDCDNVAFDDPIPEIVRIIRNVADIVETEETEFYPYTIFDGNGNQIGSATLEKD